MDKQPLIDPKAYFDMLLSDIKDQFDKALENNAEVKYTFEKTGIETHYRTNGQAFHTDNGSRKITIEIGMPHTIIS